MQTRKKLFTKPHMKELHLWIVGFFIMEEIWKDVEGYNGAYQVSNYGRIKSFKSNKGGKILKTGQDGSGRAYKGITLRNSKSKRYRLHRLVAMAFIPNPENKPQINHKDGDPSNNHIDNLEWCDSFYNMQHAVKNGLMNPPFGDDHHYSKFNKEMISDILNRIKQGEQQWKIAKSYNVSQSIISDVNRGVSYKHITLKNKGLP